MVPPQFRHTYATRHHQDGIDIRTVQQQVGHRDITSAIYWRRMHSSIFRRTRLPNSLLRMSGVYPLKATNSPHRTIDRNAQRNKRINRTTVYFPFSRSRSFLTINSAYHDGQLSSL